METKTVLFFNKLSFIVLLATLFSSIFFFLPYTSVSLFAAKGFFLSIGMTISLFFWLIARLGEGAFKIPNDKSILFGSLVPVVFLIASFFSVSKVTSFFGSGFEIGTFASMLVLFLLFFLSSIYFQTEKRLWYFYGSLFIGAFILVIFEIILISGNLIKSGIFAKMLTGLSAGNILGSWSDFALFFGLIVLLCIYTLELLKTKGNFLYLQYFLLATGFVFLAVVNMSMVWILVGIFSVIIFVYSISFQSAGVLVVHNGGQKKKFPFTALISIFICFIFIVGHSTIGSFISKYVPISNSDIRPNISATSHIVYKALRHNPVLGTGPNTFSMDWSKWRPQDVLNTLFWNTDFASGIGLLPTFVATSGLLGIGILLAFLFYILWRGFKSIKIIYKDTLANYFMMTLLLMIIYTWTVSIIYTPTIVLIIVCFASSGAFIGMLVHKKVIDVLNISFLNDPRHSFFSILTLMGLLIGTLTLTYVFAKKFVSVVYFSKSVSVENTLEGLSRAEINQKNAIVLNKNEVYYRSLSQTYIAQIGVLLNDKTVSPDRLKSSIQQLVVASEEQAKMAISSNNKQYLNYLNLADIYKSFFQLQIEKSYENAVSAYDQASILSPNNPSIYLGRASLELINKKPEEAISFIDKALSIKPNYADALLLKSQIYVDKNDLSNAISQVEIAVAYYPNEYSLYFRLGTLKYANGDYDGAVTAFENSLVLSPNYSNARFMLGKSYQKTNRNDKALVEFKILQDREPDNNDIKEAIKSLSVVTSTEVKNTDKTATPVKKK